MGNACAQAVGQPALEPNCRDHDADLLSVEGQRDRAGQRDRRSRSGDPLAAQEEDDSWLRAREAPELGAITGQEGSLERRGTREIGRPGRRIVAQLDERFAGAS
jgi:hypothetical protein